MMAWRLLARLAAHQRGRTVHLGPGYGGVRRIMNRSLQECRLVYFSFCARVVLCPFLGARWTRAIGPRVASALDGPKVGWQGVGGRERV